jgi:hypothetical protein
MWCRMGIFFILDLTFKAMHKVISDFIYKIKNNPTVSRIEKVWKNIYKNFKSSIILTLIVSLIFFFRKSQNRKFSYDKITEVVSENAKYVANAILLRDDLFLTTYDSLTEICKKRVDTNRMGYYVVMNNNAHRVFISQYDTAKNLALLQIDRTTSRIYVNFSNSDFYTILSSQNKATYIGDKVYISKSLNSGSEYFFEEDKVSEISDYGFSIKNSDNKRVNRGEAVLNEKLELIGMTVGNNTKGVAKRLTNRIDFIDLVKIKSFLLSRKIYYVENKMNVDLWRVKNYLKSMNAKVVCREEYIKVPLVIERVR